MAKLKNGRYHVYELERLPEFDGVSLRSYKNRCPDRWVWYIDGKVFAERRGPKLLDEISPKIINKNGKVRYKFRKRNKSSQEAA